MQEQMVVRFLRIPACSVVDTALEMANLTWKEQTAIELCGRKAMTQERAAGKENASVDAMQRWYRSGIEKLCTAWSGVWWIEKLAE